MSAQIELLWWDGCPSWQRALEMLRAEAEALGADPGSIRVIEISDEAAAARHGFPGSPTIRVDGEDILPAGPDQPVGLSCRVYRRRDGRISPLPDRDDLREALRRSLRKEALGGRN